MHKKAGVEWFYTSSRLTTQVRGNQTHGVANVMWMLHSQALKIELA